MLAFAVFHIRTVKLAVGWVRSVSTNIVHGASALYKYIFFLIFGLNFSRAGTKTSKCWSRSQKI